jgi:hypothetical protein
VMASSRRSWKRSTFSPAFVVKCRHADRPLHGASWGQSRHIDRQARQQSEWLTCTVRHSAPAMMVFSHPHHAD